MPPDFDAVYTARVPRAATVTQHLWSAEYAPAEQTFVSAENSFIMAGLKERTHYEGLSMATTALISILCADRIGLVAAIAGRLFDLGGNMADTTFAVLGGGAEFTAVCEFPGGVTPETIEAELRGLPELEDADVTVSSFDLAPVHGPSGHVTHQITVGGGDRPGLIARLCEVFVQFEANVVRLNAERIPGPHHDEYVVNVSVWIPDASARSCLATVTNTAGELGLSCHWEEV